MKIQIEKNDIEKVLKTFCPAVKYANGQFRFNAKGKTVSIDNPELGLKSRVSYDSISGGLDLKLDQNGICADIKLD